MRLFDFKTVVSSILAGSILCLGACAPSDDSGDEYADGTDDSWRPIGPSEDPSALVSRASKKLLTNISFSDIGKEIKVAANHMPYPDTYWPFKSGSNQNGIDDRWNGNEPSPLEKYMSLVDPENLEAAKKWEHDNHGAGVADVQSWFGHCPGWTASALMNPPCKKPAYAKSNGRGGITSCSSPTEEGCVKFEIGDVNALEAEAWLNGPSVFVGARCDTKPKDIKRTPSGAIDVQANGSGSDGGGCAGVNAASLVVIANNFMKKRHIGFAIDAQTAFNTDEIWNQPAYGYTINRLEKLTEKEAADLIKRGASTYTDVVPTATEAKGFALLDITILWVTEQGPNTEPVAGTDSPAETRMTAVLELDRELSDSFNDHRATRSDKAAVMIGGEFFDDSSAGTNRLQNHPFVWVPRGAGSENEYISPSVVSQLVAKCQ